MASPMDSRSAACPITEIRILIHDLTTHPRTEMTELYYQHGFNELDLAVWDL